MTHTTKILSRHAVLNLTLDFFQTRFGYRIWIVSDPNASYGHGGLFQGQRSDVIAWLRRNVTGAPKKRGSVN